MRETIISKPENDQALWDALEYAISCKKQSAIKPVLELIPHIKNLNVQNPARDGCSVIHYAAKLGSNVIVKTLIEHGAYPLILDMKHRSPLDYAFEHNHISTTILLSKTCAAMSSQWFSEKVQAKISEHIRTGEWENIPSRTGNLALDEAVKLEHASLAMLILDKDYHSALWYVLEQAISESDTISAKAKKSLNLLSLLLIIEIKNFNVPNNLEKKPVFFLHVAAINGMNSVVSALIQCGAYPNIWDAEGNDPFDLACQHNHIDTAVLLLELGALPIICEGNKNEEKVLKACSGKAKKRLMEKENLPSLKSSGLDWIRNKESSCVSFERGEENSDKLREIFASLKVTILSTEEIIDIEKTHRENLSGLISMALIVSKGKGSCSVNLSPLEVDKYYELSQKIVKFEHYMDCKFNIIFNDKTGENYYLASEAEILPDEVYRKFGKNLGNTSSEFRLIISKETHNAFMEHHEKRFCASRLMK